LLHCPCCAVPLSEVEGTLACVPGNMPLSPNFRKILTERYVARAQPAPPPVPGVPTSGPWYCPGCGLPPGPPNGTFCPSCGLSIGDLLFTIVELHPHGLAP
jgi:hypothetical protein